ncbi:hypothetical protein BGW36DRAFT_160325 [Talaromyces proteolyticus]|uniref:Uncharacterized protein n=1 Tax=Talaromyces proteolyticus TaxID=1131652 RepID=A0AAD4KRX5_9EURO|nr:uncharacterized protein BGW36DRAFT_160325 [Talaromyces proteolyticus]KAH8697062.1 hypothetical protein BGW36DRAFT_160325 [Talaromyces proteolyticus]
MACVDPSGPRGCNYHPFQNMVNMLCSFRVQHLAMIPRSDSIIHLFLFFLFVFCAYPFWLVRCFLLALLLSLKDLVQIFLFLITTLCCDISEMWSFVYIVYTVPLDRNMHYVINAGVFVSFDLFCQEFMFCVALCLLALFRGCDPMTILPVIILYILARPVMIFLVFVSSIEEAKYEYIPVSCLISNWPSRDVLEHGIIH